MKNYTHLSRIFVHLGAFIVMSLTGNVHLWLECTKTRSPRIDTVLHWRAPNIHSFDTDPSLLVTVVVFFLISHDETKSAKNTL